MTRWLKKEWLWAVAAQVAFLAYLCCPIAAGQVRPDGTMIYVRGWERVVQMLFSTADSPLGHFLFYVCFLPFNLANAMFCSLFFLQRANFFQTNWAKFCIAAIFILGTAEYGLLFFESGQGIGTWLWLIAAVLGTTSCLLSVKYSVIKQPDWKSFWRRRTMIFFSLATVLVLSLWLAGYQIYYGEIFGCERETYNSPDNRFQIVVLARGINLFPGAPGDAGGVPANVSIVDQKTGRRIAREPIDMAYLVGPTNDIIWSATNVSIVDVGQWELPSGKFNPLW